MAQPKYIFKNPWAHKRTDTEAPFPPDTQTNPGSGRTSIALGFPNETMIPQSNGGIPPYGQDFNGIFRAITENLAWYSVGGMFEYDANRSYDAPALVFYGGQIYQCLRANNAGNKVAPGSNASYWRRVVNEQDITPIYTDFSGMVSFFASSSAPSSNWLVCNGQAVSRSVYAGLFAQIGTTYGAGNGSTTFNLPNLVNRVAWGATSGVGSAIEAGLPNIKGTFDGNVNDGTGGKTGPFYYTGTYYNGADGDGGGGGLIGFDASRVNAIYGNSSTVQPPALKLLPCIHV